MCANVEEGVQSDVLFCSITDTCVLMLSLVQDGVTSRKEQRKINENYSSHIAVCDPFPKASGCSGGGR